MSISDNRMEKAICYLVETDESAAMAKSLMIGLEEQKRTVISIAMLDSTAKSAAMKEVDARVSDGYKAWRENYTNAVYEYEAVRNKRITEAAVIEAWKSYNFNKNKGNVV